MEAVLPPNPKRFGNNSFLWHRSPICRLISNGPGRNRTCDLGNKSPGQLAETNRARVKRAANHAVRRCNELQRNSFCGDKLVRTLYAHAVGRLDNSPSFHAPAALKRTFYTRTGASLRKRTPPSWSHQERDERGRKIAGWSAVQASEIAIRSCACRALPRMSQPRPKRRISLTIGSSARPFSVSSYSTRGGSSS